MIDWGLNPQEAAALPHAVNRFGIYDLEAGTTAEGLNDGLSGIGYETNARALTSGLHLIAIGETLQGGADPRREGIALGE
jgi:gamma-glutamyltranspeptidase/glutathione hydrolase